MNNTQIENIVLNDVAIVTTLISDRIHVLVELTDMGWSLPSIETLCVGKPTLHQIINSIGIQMPGNVFDDNRHISLLWQDKNIKHLSRLHLGTGANKLQLTLNQSDVLALLDISHTRNVTMETIMFLDAWKDLTSTAQLKYNENNNSLMHDDGDVTDVFSVKVPDELRDSVEIIKWLMWNNNETQVVLGKTKVIGSQARVSGIVAGKSKLTKADIVSLCKHYNVHYSVFFRELGFM